MTDLRLIYVTVSSASEAEQIAGTLLDERLIACANILPQMQSLYRWKGQIKMAHESVLILKTAQALVDAVSTRVKALHSYECPCVVSLVIENGNPDYLNWLKSETNEDTP